MHNNSYCELKHALDALTKTVSTPFFKEYMSDPVTNYNYIEDAQVSVSIKKTNANKCTLSEKFLNVLIWIPGFSGGSKRV